MNLIVILLVVLLVCGIGVAPIHPWSQNYGYYPSGGIGLILVVLLILLILGRI